MKTRLGSMLTVVASLFLASSATSFGAAIFTENFNSLSQSGTDVQQTTGLKIGASKTLTAWTKAGDGTVHCVDRTGSGNWAVMFYGGNTVAGRNVITSSAIASANLSNNTYRVTFDLSAANYKTSQGNNGTTDGVVVTVLNSSGGAITNRTFVPGSFVSLASAGSLPFTTVSFDYVGTGSGTGAASFKIESTSVNATRFGGSIDNLVVSDTTPPTIASLTPADDATGAPVGDNLTATFSENIQKGTGNITLKKSADNSTVETFDVATSSRITVSGATLTIDPTSPLAGLTGYYVLIDATAVKNIAGFFFVGISDSATWNFTTATDDTTAPTIASLNPADDASGVAVNVTLTATFSEIIQKGTGNITLKKSADNSTVETFDVATSSRITVSGATLTIAPTSLLGAATGYYVEIAAGAIKDLVDNAFAGISGNAAWNFTTATPRQLTWDANGTGAGLTDGTGNWLDANQWWDGAANTAWTYNDSATIGSGGSGGIITLASPTAAGRVTFTNFTDSYTLTGGSLLVNSNLTVASGNVSISTPVGGSGGITKTGEGTLTLSGANTYSGGTLINGGTLLLGSDNPLGIGTTTVTNGATLDLGTRWNTRAITLNGGTLANTPSPSVVHGDGGNVTIIFSGNGTLTSASNNSWIHVRSTTGSGTMVINASSSGVYNAQGTTWANTGGVVLQNGGISLYAGRTITGGPVTINNGTFSTLGINQIGTLLPVTVNGGTWELSGAQTIGSLAGTGGTVNLSTNTLATGGNNADTTYAGAITGTNGALVKTGSGTLTLSGASTYAGATTVSNGTLAFVTGGSCSNSAVTVADNAALGVVVTNSATQWKCSSLIFSSGTGSKLKYVFDVTPSTGLTGLAPLRINNNLTFTGTPTVDVNPTNLVTGMKYPLVDVGGSAPTSTVPTLTGVGGSLSWVGNTLYLIMPPRGTFISFF